MSLEVELSDGETSIAWEIEQVTDAPNGRYLLLDDDAQPRLILTASELQEVAGVA